MELQTPFSDQFKTDPCLVSVCMGPNYKTVMEYPYTPLYAVYQYIIDPAFLGGITQQIRSCSDHAQRAKLKGSLPYMTFAALMEYRRTEYIIRPTGTLILDIDHLKSFEDAEALKNELFNDQNLKPRLVFVSPSGLGVKAVITRPLSAFATNEMGQRNNQNGVNAYFNQHYAARYGTTADPQGSELVKCCSLCHDPKALFQF